LVLKVREALRDLRVLEDLQAPQLILAQEERLVLVVSRGFKGPRAPRVRRVLQAQEDLMDLKVQRDLQELQAPPQVLRESQVQRVLEVPLELELRALVDRQDQEVETKGLLVLLVPLVLRVLLETGVLQELEPQDLLDPLVQGVLQGQGAPQVRVLQVRGGPRG
tara:strand:- start:161 stop:652 length:492 start_codon:yes stop_codon:yes gene_type:complete